MHISAIPMTTILFFTLYSNYAKCKIASCPAMLDLKISANPLTKPLRVCYTHLAIVESDQLSSLIKSTTVAGTMVGEPREVERLFSARSNPRKLGPRPADLQAAPEKKGVSPGERPPKTGHRASQN